MKRHLMARLEQDIGDNFDLTVTGGWSKQEVDSRTDYNLVAGNSLAGNVGIATLVATAAAPGGLFPAESIPTPRPGPL
jgi:iron complex outermembrane receptor protein